MACHGGILQSNLPTQPDVSRHKCVIWSFSHARNVYRIRQYQLLLQPERSIRRRDVVEGVRRLFSCRTSAIRKPVAWILPIIASNTPHNRFETITRDLGIPVLSIFQAVADVCTHQGIEQFLLLEPNLP